MRMVDVIGDLFLISFLMVGGFFGFLEHIMGYRHAMSMDRMPFDRYFWLERHLWFVHAVRAIGLVIWGETMIVFGYLTLTRFDYEEQEALVQYYFMGCLIWWTTAIMGFGIILFLVVYSRRFRSPEQGIY